MSKVKKRRTLFIIRLLQFLFPKFFRPKIKSDYDTRLKNDDYEIGIDLGHNVVFVKVKTERALPSDIVQKMAWVVPSESVMQFAIVEFDYDTNQAAFINFLANHLFRATRPSLASIDAIAVPKHRAHTYKILRARHELYEGYTTLTFLPEKRRLALLN